MIMRRISPSLTLITLAVTGTALSACGSVGNLEPPDGKSLPPAPYGSEKQANADDLITPTVQTRPGRSDELLRRSNRRETDPFDLPPGSEMPDTTQTPKDAAPQSTPAEPE